MFTLLPIFSVCFSLSLILLKIVNLFKSLKLEIVHVHLKLLPAHVYFKQGDMSFFYVFLQCDTELL